MDHVELKPYPMPAGAPVLMPYQDLPFNGDGYAAAEVLRLKEKHGCTNVVETGTCLGSTAIWFAQNFSMVITIEAHKPYLDIANERLFRVGNTLTYYGESAERLKSCTSADFYFLDAHWGRVCPLLDELQILATDSRRPVIMIHDFQVPDRPDLGYDCFPDGKPFSLKAVAPYLDKIYGKGQWTHHFNDKAEGACRGILYVEPA